MVKIICGSCQKEFEKENFAKKNVFCPSCWKEAIKNNFCLLCQKSGVHLH